jgi:hypothetical protein
LCFDDVDFYGAASFFQFALYEISLPQSKITSS